ncbi:MAG: LysR family transcriptional regulator [Rhodospirillales bacterium]|nr:LysR family transcriptional regulator [Rhodospirillales bacterium]
MARRRLPSLNGLRAFEAAGRHGRMTLAAAELGVTHGAVSRQVRQLEASLGVKLFEGPKNRLVLTEAGRALLPHLTAALDRIETAVRSVADLEAGPLDVSCLGTFMMRWLIPRLHRFRAAHPEIDVRLSASDAPVDFARLAYEVAIRVDDHAAPSGARVAVLFTEHCGPVLSPGLASALGLMRVEQLAAAPRLQTKTRATAWPAWAQRAGLDARVLAGGAEYEHFYFMLEAATAGLGVAIAPWPLVIDDLEAGRLVAPFGFIASGLSYVVACRDRPSRKAARFVAWLEREAAATPRPPPFRAASRSPRPCAPAASPGRNA